MRSRRVLVLLALFLIALPARAFPPSTSQPLGDSSRYFDLQWTTPWVEFGIDPAGLSHLAAATHALALANEDGRLFVVSISTGQLLLAPDLTIDPTITPRFTSDQLFVLNNTHSLTAIDTDSGALRWHAAPIAAPQDLLASEDAVYVLADPQEVLAFDTTTGAPLWRRPLEGADWFLITAAQAGCVVASDQGTLACLAPPQGDPVWSATLPGVDPSLSAVHRDTLFLADPQTETIYELTLDTGALVKRYRVGETSGVPGPIFLARGLLHATDLHLLVIGTGGIGNLRVFDRQSAQELAVETVSGDPASVHALDNGRVLLISSTMSRGDLSIYDDARDLVGHRTELGTSGYAIASSPDTVVFATETGLAMARPNLPAMLDVWNTSHTVDPHRLLPPLAQVLVLLASTWAFASLGRPRIPPAAETSLLLSAIVATAAIAGVVSVSAAAVLTVSLLQIRPSAAGLAFAILLLLPSLALAMSYVIGYQRRVRRLERQAYSSPADAVGGAFVLGIFDSLRAQMDLPQTVRLVFSRAAGFSPFAVGPRRRRARLVVPHNVYSLAKAACDDDDVLAGDLLRLVIAHELAHARSGDVRALPLLAALRGALTVCILLVLAAYLLIAWRHSTELVVLVTRPAVALLVIGLVVLRLFLWMTIRARERLADATATLYVSPHNIERLVIASAHSPHSSPLSRFVVALSAVVPFSSSFMGFAVASGSRRRAWLTRSRWSAAALERLSSRSHERGQAIASKAHALVGDPAALPLGLLIAPVLGAYLCAAVQALLTLGFLAHMADVHPKGDPRPLAAFLNAMESWPRTEAGALWSMIQRVAPLTTACIIMAFLLLPLRDPVRRRVRVWELFILAFIALTLFNVVHSLFRGWCSPEFPSFPTIRISDSAVTMWSLPVLLAFLLALLVRSQRGGRSMPMLKELGFALLACGTVVALALLALAELRVPARLAWGAVACILAAAAANSRALAWLGWHYTVVEEWLHCRGGLGQCTRLWSTCDARGKRVEHHTSRLLVEVLLKYLLVPCAILAIVYPLLRWVDIDYIDHYAARHRTLLALMDQGPEAIRADRYAFARAFLPRSLIHSFVGPDRLAPSEALAVLCLTLLTLGAGGFSSLEFVWRNRESARLAAQIPARCEAGRLLGIPPLSSSQQKRLTRQLARVIRRRRPYSRGYRGLPRMSYTCDILLTAQTLGVAHTQGAWALDWVSRCECSDGGFAASPGLPADLAHTAAGLRLFKALGKEPAIGATLHAAWLNCSLARTMYGSWSFTPAEFIELLSLAVGALRTLPGEHDVVAAPVSDVVEAATRCWHATGGIHETRCLVEILDALNARGHQVQQQVRDDWLPQRERSLARLNPTRCLGDVVDLLLVLRLMYPESYQSREAFIQATDNLRKALFQDQPGPYHTWRFASVGRRRNPGMTR